MNFNLITYFSLILKLVSKFSRIKIFKTNYDNIIIKTNMTIKLCIFKSNENSIYFQESLENTSRIVLWIKTCQ